MDEIERRFHFSFKSRKNGKKITSCVVEFIHLPFPRHIARLILNRIFEELALQKSETPKGTPKDKEQIYEAILKKIKRMIEEASFWNEKILTDTFEISLDIDCERECYELTSPSFYILSPEEVFFLMLKEEFPTKKYKMLDMNIFSIIETYIY